MTTNGTYLNLHTCRCGAEETRDMLKLLEWRVLARKVLLAENRSK